MVIVQGYGDLPTKAPFVFGAPKAFGDVTAALRWLKDVLDFQDEDLIETGRVSFDPEDDRIVIWEANPDAEDNTVKVVWHASGWHWPYDASDLAGGPLEQGRLPGCTETVYDIANRE